MSNIPECKFFLPTDLVMHDGRLEVLTAECKKLVPPFNPLRPEEFQGLPSAASFTGKNTWCNDKPVFKVRCNRLLLNAKGRVSRKMCTGFEPETIS